MKAIILAAGQGKRLHSYTNGLPKCLLKLGSESILEREIRLLLEAGISRNDIYVVGGYRYECLMDIAPNLIINDCYDTKENSYSLALVFESVQDDTLILDADLCFETALLEKVLQNPYKNVLLSRCSQDLDESTGIVTAENQQIVAVGKQYANTGYVYISIFKIAGEIIPDFKHFLMDEKSEKTWYTSAITELCSQYAFYNMPVTDKWHEIDFIEDYEETLTLFGLER